jgi:predicted amidohydrolase YtcJ
VVLGDDIARVGVKELRHLPVAMTVVEGQVVYEG